MDADAWNERYDTAELVWHAEPNQFVAAELADLPPGRAIDLACGEGRNAIWLAGQGWEATGVDFSSVAIDKARRLADSAGVTVDWRVEDATQFVPEPGGFDLVVLAYFQLPIEQMAGVYERAAAAVAPGGTFFLVAHDRSNLDGGYGGPQAAEVLPTPEEVVAHLGDLVVDRAEVVIRQVDTDDGPRAARDTLVRAHRPEI